MWTASAGRQRIGTNDSSAVSASKGLTLPTPIMASRVTKSDELNLRQPFGPRWPLGEHQAAQFGRTVPNAHFDVRQLQPEFAQHAARTITERERLQSRSVPDGLLEFRPSKQISQTRLEIIRLSLIRCGSSLAPFGHQYHVLGQLVLC